MSDQARPELHLDEKWDKVINSMFSRSAMGGLAGAVAGFLLFSVSLFLKTHLLPGFRPSSGSKILNIMYAGSLLHSWMHWLRSVL